MGLMDEKITNSVSKSEGVEAEFRSIAAKEKADILKELSCSDKGIGDEEREERLEKYGYNDLSANQKHSWLYFIVHSFTDAFILVLLVLTCKSLRKWNMIQSGSRFRVKMVLK